MIQEDRQAAKDIRDFCDSQEGSFESKPVRKKLHAPDVVEDDKGLEY